MLSTGLQLLRRQRRVLTLTEGAFRPQKLVRTRVPVVAKLWPQNGVQTRGFAMPAAILNQMDLLGRRYDELAHELSQYATIYR
ncbi:hypothetical protein P3T76_005811 [Phytophthora citrophthora]|uniref:Uncharacterized protein n=1 Tax=Phytophthora citrophthora TaxID=4793 RepID=A0AAD9GRD5_9STRA|nr:hypothetical protein P3T76_005811 [Phytophthora citrophthora]